MIKLKLKKHEIIAQFRTNEKKHFIIKLGLAFRIFEMFRLLVSQKQNIVIAIKLTRNISILGRVLFILIFVRKNNNPTAEKVKERARDFLMRGFIRRDSRSTFVKIVNIKEKRKPT